MSAHSLPRTERLRSLGAVRRLFESGESGFIFPFRYVWFAEPDTDVEERQAGEPGPGADLLVEGDAAL